VLNNKRGGHYDFPFLVTGTLGMVPSIFCSLFK